MYVYNLVCVYERPSVDVLSSASEYLALWHLLQIITNAVIYNNSTIASVFHPTYASFATCDACVLQVSADIPSKPVQRRVMTTQWRHTLTRTFIEQPDQSNTPQNLADVIVLNFHLDVFVWFKSTCYFTRVYLGIDATAMTSYRCNKMKSNKIQAFKPCVGWH